MKTIPGQLELTWLQQVEGIAFSPYGRNLLIGCRQQPSPLIPYKAIP